MLQSHLLKRRQVTETGATTFRARLHESALHFCKVSIRAPGRPKMPRRWCMNLQRSFGRPQGTGIYSEHYGADLLADAAWAARRRRRLASYALVPGVSIAHVHFRSSSSSTWPTHQIYPWRHGDDGLQHAWTHWLAAQQAQKSSRPRRLYASKERHRYACGSPCDGEKLGVGERAAGRGDVIADIIKIAQIEVLVRVEDVAACAVDSWVATSRCSCKDCRGADGYCR